jgi:hypothetical protein
VDVMKRNVRAHSGPDEAETSPLITPIFAGHRILTEVDLLMLPLDPQHCPPPRWAMERTRRSLDDRPRKIRSSSSVGDDVSPSE